MIQTCELIPGKSNKGGKREREGRLTIKKKIKKKDPTLSTTNMMDVVPFCLDSNQT